MKYELIVRPEPFSWPAEVDGYEAFGQWQGETRRDDPSDIRWVQDSLNRLMNLRLPLTGVMDAAARSALRSFQEKRSLTADGVLGPGTKRALAEAATYPGEEEAFPVSRLPARARAALTQGALAKKTSFRYVKDFSGPASECAEALKRAGKSRAEALSIINAQIGVAIAMLRKSATALKRGSRSDKTKTLFQKILKVKPEFVPTWLKPTATIKDRGDVVATRCKRVAELLASGTIKFFCTINSTNCPDCSNDPRKFACSSYGNESKAPKNSRVVCLGDLFWDDMKAGKTDSLLATIMHEPFHIYYGVYVTEHRSDAGKFGGINCIVQFVFETNGRAAPDRVHERCTNMVVRKEVGGFLSFRPEPFLWPTESEWEGEASRTGPDYIRWLQSSLNRVMGLRLAVDGIMGPATRSAVRSFQQRKGLAVDGIVGPQTEASLRALTGTLSLGSVPVSASVAPRSLPSPCGPALLPCQTTIIDHFAASQAVAEPSYQTNYDAAIKDLATCIGDELRGFQAYGVIRIIGYASAEGSVGSNKALGQRRADQVIQDLQKALLSQGLAVQTFSVGPIDGVVILKAETGGEGNLLISPERTENDRKQNRRVEIDLSGLFRKSPPAPAKIDTLITKVKELVDSLPFTPPLDKANIVLPTTARFLDPAEQIEAKKVYGGSLDFTKILITDGLGAGSPSGRPFTLAVELTSGGWHVVIMMGDVLCWAPPSEPKRQIVLIHELAHAWQSQHHGTDPTAFIYNSVKSQAAAVTATAVEKLLGSGKKYDEYAYTNPPDPNLMGFDEYSAEQIAQQVQHHYQDMRFGKHKSRNPNPIVLDTIRSPAPNAPVPANEASLEFVWAERYPAPGVWR